MSNPYIDNPERWLALAETNYLIEFVKQWIPFNAWYKNMYPTFSTDREAINEIKSNPNVFRDKLLALLNGNSNDALMFKNHLAALHHLLEANYIPNADKRVSFTSIVAEKNPHHIEIRPFYNWTYQVEVIYTGVTNFTVNSLVTDSNSATKYSYSRPRFNVEELTQNITSSTSFTQAKIDTLIKVYECVNPNKPINLVTNDVKNSIIAGDILLIDDIEKLAKALVEILYKLRCILFHGELIPNAENQLAYEPAYNILRVLIQSLK